MDDIPAKTRLKQAIEDWAAEKMNNIPAPLYLVMVDHGYPEEFFINDNDVLTAKELDSYFDTLESRLQQGEAIREPRTIIMDSCHSGSFINELSQAPQMEGGTVQNGGRAILISGTESEKTYRGPPEPDGVSDGSMFLKELFQQLRLGYSLRQSFEEATQSVERTYVSNKVNSPVLFGENDYAEQHPLLDDNGDGVGSNVLYFNNFNKSSDGYALGERKLGVDTGLVNSAENPATVTEITPAITRKAGGKLFVYHQ